MAIAEIMLIINNIKSGLGFHETNDYKFNIFVNHCLLLFHLFLYFMNIITIIYSLLLELYSSSLTMRVGAQLDSDLNTLPLKVEGSGLPLRFSVEAITKL